MYCTRSLQWCTSASVCRSVWPSSDVTISLILYNRSRCQLTDCTGHQRLKRKLKSEFFDILLTYIQRTGEWQVFVRKWRKLKDFRQVHKEVLGTSNSLGKPLYVLVIRWYLPGPQSQWQQPIVSSSLSASHLKKKKEEKTNPQNKIKQLIKKKPEQNETQTPPKQTNKTKNPLN